MFVITAGDRQKQENFWGLGKKMFRSPHKTRFLCVLVVAFFSLGSASCSYWESRRAKAIARGNHLFELHCSGCHGRRRIDLQRVPPDLHGVFDNRFLPSGRPATDDIVRSTILTGRSGIMPSFAGSLSDENIQDIILYLHTLKVPSQGATPAAEHTHSLEPRFPRTCNSSTKRIYS